MYLLSKDEKRTVFEPCREWDQMHGSHLRIKVESEGVGSNAGKEEDGVVALYSLRP